MYERTTRKPYGLQARLATPHNPLRPPVPTTDPHVTHLTTYLPRPPHHRTPEATRPRLDTPRIAGPFTMIGTPQPPVAVARAYPRGTDPRTAFHRRAKRSPAHRHAHTRRHAQQPSTTSRNLNRARLPTTSHDLRPVPTPPHNPPRPPRRRAHSHGTDPHPTPHRHARPRAQTRAHTQTRATTVVHRVFFLFRPANSAMV